VAADPDPDITVFCEGKTEQLSIVHDALERFWRGLNSSLSERERLRFDLAVTEIAANIIEHARASAMRLHLSVRDGCAIADFSDTGRAMADPPDPAHAIEAMAAADRGLILVRAAVDEFTYERRHQPMAAGQAPLTARRLRRR